MYRQVSLIGYLLAAVSLFAQGSGSAGPTGPPPGLGDAFPDRPFDVTRTAVGALGAIQDGLVTVEDEKIREPRKLRLVSKVRVTADKNSALAGRKKLTLSDLTAGMYVRVTYRAETREVVEIRVLKPKGA